jgi:hypothetical protein
VKKQQALRPLAAPAGRFSDFLLGAAMRARFYLTAAAGLVLATDAYATVFTLTVGSASTPTLFAAATAANNDPNPANDYDILIPTGTYTNDFANVTRPMTIEASGGPVTLLADGALPLLQDKGIIVTTSGLTVKGITFQGAAIDQGLGGNGAGIRDQSNSASTLRVENSTFRNNQNGILTSGDTGNTFQEQIQIINSQFFDNGSGTGQTHALYVGDALSLLVQGSLFCGTLEGHDIKSRAMNTTVQGSKVFDGATGAGCSSAGTTSYGIEATNGGTVKIENTDIFQGPGTHNSTMLRYGADGLYANSSLDITNTNFLSTSGGTGIQAPAGATSCTLTNTTFTGVNTPVDPASFCTTATTPPDGPVAVPEPQSLWLLLTAALGFGTAFFARAAVQL